MPVGVLNKGQGPEQQQLLGVIGTLRDEQPSGLALVWAQPRPVSLVICQPLGLRHMGRLRQSQLLREVASHKEHLTLRSSSIATGDPVHLALSCLSPLVAVQSGPICNVPPGPQQKT